MSDARKSAVSALSRTKSLSATTKVGKNSFLQSIKSFD